MLNKKTIKTFIYCMIILIIFLVLTLSTSAVVNSYLPNIDQAQVPEFEGIKQSGVNAINLFTGAATYFFEIDVPDGVNGLKPPLSINYNHQKTNNLPTLLGYAWDLNRFEIIRNINYTRGDSSDDYFELYFNGANHKIINNGTDYVTEIETFYYFEYTSNYWILKTPDGTSYRFGYNSDSNLVSSEESYTTKWSIDQIEDVYGNTIEYDYTENNGVVEINEINYGEASILFSYDSTILHERRFFIQGSEVNSDNLISDIDVYYDGDLVRGYEFSYTTFSESWGSKSLLESITKLGNDASIESEINFSYYEGETGWRGDDTYDLPEEIDDGEDEGYRFIDLSRDGLVDFLHVYQEEDEDYDEIDIEIWLNNGNGWDESSWEVPFAFTFEYDGHEGIDRGVRFLDLDGDGFIDYIISQEDESDNPDDIPSTQYIYFNTGEEFSIDTSGSYDPPDIIDWYDGTSNGVHSEIFGYDKGCRITDINGDGLDDILRQDSSVRVNSGEDWNTYTSSYWISPYDFVDTSIEVDDDCPKQRGVNQGVYLADVNGDGLPDLIASYDSSVSSVEYNEVWINDGEEFVLDSSWEVPTEFVEDETSGTFGEDECAGIAGNDQGVRLADVNGDGMIDILRGREDSTKRAWINIGNDWDSESDWAPTFDFVEDDSNEIGYKSTDVRLVDLNGDGLVDIIKGDDAFINQAEKNLLLESITNEYGAEISFDYKKSTELDNTGDDDTSDLGFNVWIVDTISYNNGMSGIHHQQNNYSYDYEAGKYDYEEKEFAGFSYIKETRPDDSYIEHYFHQDKPLSGLEYSSMLYDSSNHLYFEKTNTYDYTFNYNYVIELNETCDYTYGSESSAYSFCKNYDYDNYGNIVTTYEEGTRASTNARYTYFDYVYNTDNWIVNKVSSEQVYNSLGSTLLKETLYYYDGETHGLIGDYGALTKTEELINSLDYKEHIFEYNSYGNLVNETDDNGHTTYYLYNSDNLYLRYVINQLAQTITYEYDSGTGNLISEEDANGYVVEYEYDQYGRQTTEIKEYDSSSAPSIEYEYYFDGSAPEYIIKKEKEAASSTYDTTYYYDGFGNPIQIKYDDETSSNDIEYDIFYNDLNLISSVSYPYEVTASTSYSTPDESINSIFYEYDTLGRETIITKPDGSEIEKQYFETYTTIYDENDNLKSYYYDGFNNINTVREYIYMDGTTHSYYTYYDYNELGLLTDIEDSSGNEFSFEYDYLGRLIELDDPDLGEWNYEYDGEGNLVEQQDAETNIITMQYDELNRIINKSTSYETIIYEYDDIIGTLSSVSLILLIFSFVILSMESYSYSFVKTIPSIVLFSEVILSLLS